MSVDIGYQLLLGVARMLARHGDESQEELDRKLDVYLDRMSDSDKKVAQLLKGAVLSNEALDDSDEADMARELMIDLVEPYKTTSNA